MKYRKKPGDDGPDEWIVTYSDMVTLLLAFFILLFSFSSVDATKWQALVESFTGEVAFMEDESTSSILEDNYSVIDTGHSTVKDDREENPPTDAEVERARRDFRSLYMALSEYNDENGLNMEVTMLGTEIRIRLANNLLFNSAKADLNSLANKTLLDLTEIIKEYDDILDRLVLEGHTDNLPINNSEFRDNFELSLERALNVLYYFKYQGDFDPRKLIAMGYGEYNPVATNDTVEGRAENRRTDILLVRIGEE
ncbi:MAG: flagellar motor protein MotB [Clostridia bacterium]